MGIQKERVLPILNVLEAFKDVSCMRYDDMALLRQLLSATKL